MATNNFFLSNLPVDGLIVLLGLEHCAGVFFQHIRQDFDFSTCIYIHIGEDKLRLALWGILSN